MFSTTRVKLGAVKVGSKNKVEFPYTNIDLIFSISASCGCSAAYNDPANQKVVVEYTAQEVPDHLMLQGQRQYTTEKFLTVVYQPKESNDHLTIQLSFEVTVKHSI